MLLASATPHPWLTHAHAYAVHAYACHAYATSSPVRVAEAAAELACWWQGRVGRREGQLVGAVGGVYGSGCTAQRPLRGGCMQGDRVVLGVPIATLTRLNLT